MDNKTKNYALKKLNLLQIHYGVPNIFNDIKFLNDDLFKNLKIDKTKSFLDNIFNIYRKSKEYEFNQIGKINSSIWALENIDELVTYNYQKNILSKYYLRSLF